jgi:hypothetical protein
MTAPGSPMNTASYCQSRASILSSVTICLALNERPDGTAETVLTCSADLYVGSVDMENQDIHNDTSVNFTRNGRRAPDLPCRCHHEFRLNFMYLDNRTKPTETYSTTAAAMAGSTP